MPSITFTCRSLTPMFLQRARPVQAEGNQLKNPDLLLNPSSIKGPLRFWWRAMIPYCSENDLDLLKDRESYLFGGFYGDKIRKSKIRIRTKVLAHEWETDFMANRIKGTNIKIEPDENTGESKSKEYPRTGRFWKSIKYLFYSKESSPCFWSINFEVYISCINTEVLNEVVQAFWLLTVFGGIGSRARRGAGGFEIIGYKTSSFKTNLQLLHKGNSFEEFCALLKVNLGQILGDSVNKISPSVGDIPRTLNYCNLSRCRIFAIDYDKESEPLSALNVVAQNYKAVRIGSTNNGKIPIEDINEYSREDYYSIKGYLSPKLMKREEFEIKNTIHKAKLGLPMIYKYRSLKSTNPNLEKDESVDYNSALIQGQSQLKNPKTGISLKIYDRVASNLHFSLSGFFRHENIRELKGRKASFFPLIIKFESRVLPTNSELVLKGKGKRAQVDQADRGKGSENQGEPNKFPELILNSPDEIEDNFIFEALLEKFPSDPNRVFNKKIILDQ